VIHFFCLAMFPVTDIPDWCVYESNPDFGSYDHNLTGSAELLTQFYERSPIKHIDRVSFLLNLRFNKQKIKFNFIQGQNANIVFDWLDRHKSASFAGSAISQSSTRQKCPHKVNSSK
jgi:hypothetical protein